MKFCMQAHVTSMNVWLKLIVQKEGQAKLIRHAFLFAIGVSARGGSCEQGYQNGYKSGLPFTAGFLFYICIHIE